jgi:type I restriction-modification system DNA methylase subunit
MNELFLTAVYEQLDLQSGSLLAAVSLPNDEKTKEAWLNKGDWLELAAKIGAEKVFFVKDEPVIVFCQLDNPTLDKELEIVLKAWCMSRPQRLFLALPTELRVYDLTHLPVTVNKETQQLEKPLKTVERITDVLDVLKDYRREQLESGYLPKQEKRFGQRADKQLIQDLKLVREELKKQGLKLEYAHALISRAIFVRYLEDRDILTKEYFIKVANNNSNWLALLDKPLEKSAFNPENKKHFFCQVLQNKAFTYALFNKLSEDFNGDLFHQDELEENHVEQKYLGLLRGFLLGDTEKQQKIFFHLYDFKIVPIELISNIYEEFYHNTTKAEDSKGTGSHYTPSVLAEFVLSEVLTSERLKTNPTVLDPACGSGIFLVEAFRRIVRFNINDKGRSLNALELRDILKNQIRGIEINNNAIEITAFSLYLALLHYQEPKDILEQIKMVAPSDKPLPHLIYISDKTITEGYYNNLFNCNAFSLMDLEYEILVEKLIPNKRFKGRSEIEKFLKFSEKLPLKPNSIDIIVGNPPWGAEENKNSDTKKDDGQAKLWCKIFGWKIGDKELSQAFIARSLFFLKENTGESALLVSAGVFFKRHENSQLFRSKWLSQTTVKKVVNFAHVRHAFFSAISPFSFVHYQNKPASFAHRVQHWSAKKTEAIENNQAVILYNSDIRKINQYDLINNEQLWKIYWWGGHRDASLIQILQLEQPLLNFVDKDENGKSLIGQGFSKGNIKNSDRLKNYEFFDIPLRSNAFKRYGSLDKKFFGTPPSYVHRFNNDFLYDGWRLLVKRGVTTKENGQIV